MASTKPSISIIVPALNEEKAVGPTVEAITAGLVDKFSRYEILIIDDGSTDGTADLSEALASRDSNIRVVHNPRNMGLGYNYRKGVELARNDYVVLFPGDNQFPADSISELLRHVGRADIIIPYHTNDRIRPWHRRLISRLFILTVNSLFGLSVKYYTGTVIHKRRLIRSVPISSTGFAYQAEALTRLLRSGHSYLEVGIQIQEREFGTTTIFRWKNIRNVLTTMAALYGDIRIRGRRRYNKRPQKVMA